jgi:hypothetical protein
VGTSHKALGRLALANDIAFSQLAVKGLRSGKGRSLKMKRNFIALISSEKVKTILELLVA